MFKTMIDTITTRRTMVLLVLFLLSTPAFGQVDLVPERFDFGGNENILEGITSPASHLGYAAGEQFSFHHDVVDYLTILSEESDRVSMFEYGTSHEGRSLHYLVITSPENHARIEDIRQNNLRLADGLDLTDADAAKIIEENPSIVWLSYNVHGNEASSTEASLQVANRLASSTDAVIQNVLNETVVILDPTINPDGRDRYVYWYRSMANNVVNAMSEELEHDEAWPGGRTNHYWFDLNRDWLWLVHPESQGRIKAYQKWLPQVHVDYHEQGFNSNYFTMPGTTPRNLEIPSAYDDWASVFGKANTDAFDQHKINYATNESFDFFYPGYGSSYPTNMGAIGMLNEQGGHSRGGRAVKTDDEYILTLRQRIFDHFTTSFATLETSAAHRKELLAYFRSFFNPSDSDSHTYIFPDDAGAGHLYRMLHILDEHGVQIQQTTEDATISANSYRDESTNRISVPAGSFVISSDQPRGVFINTVLKRDLALEDSVTYDMTSWSMPLAFNLDAYVRDGTSGLSLQSVVEIPQVDGTFVDVEDPYAFVINWNQSTAPAALAELWRKEYKVRSVRKPFQIGGKEYGRGTLVVLAGRNLARQASFSGDMESVAMKTGVDIVAVRSGSVEKGINLASSDSRPVSKPSVALIVDTPVSSYSAGQIWYMFDKDIGFGINRIRHSDFKNADLSDLDVIILPDFGGSVSAMADSVLQAKLKSWVSNGGVLIGLERSAELLTKDRSGLTAIELKPSLESEKSDSSKVDDEILYLRYEDRQKNSGLKRIPSSAFRGIVDTSNPLAFGMTNDVYSLKQRTSSLLPSEKYQVVGHYQKDEKLLLAAGYASQEEQSRIAGSVFAAVQPGGRGKYVLLVDNTQYRYFWIGPSRLLVNATMLLHGL